MSGIKLRPLAMGDGDPRHRISLGMAVMPDVEDDKAWNTIVEMGVPHYIEWSQGIVRKETRAFALSYKHTEHDYGKLSRDQANELREVLSQLVGSGPDRAILWVDSMYMTREGLGFEDYSSRWVQYGLVPYEQLPVIRLTCEWDRTHPGSGKRSAWLWLERTLGRCNKGLYTRDGIEKEDGKGVAVKDALRMWLQVKNEYGFRPSDEEDVLAEISGKSAHVSALFRCPGGSSCIGYILGERKTPCGGRSEECVRLARATNGTAYENKLILERGGRIAIGVLTIIEPQDRRQKPHLRLENLSRTELQKYTKILISRSLPLRNIRWLGLERFD